MLEIYKSRADFARSRGISWKKADAYFRSPGMIEAWRAGKLVGYIDPLSIVSPLLL